MTITEARQAWRLDHILDRGRTALHLTTSSITLRLLALTSHGLCRQVLRDPRFGVRQLDGQRVGDDPIAQAANGSLADSFLDLDPPDHTRLRRLAAPAFRPAIIRGFTDRLEALAIVLLDLAAANRDPDVYPHPDRFDLDRPRDVEHLAFSSGIHYCLGAPLARLEAAVAYRVLTQRLPSLRPRSGARARRRRGSTIRGYRGYPVTS